MVVKDEVDLGGLALLVLQWLSAGFQQKKKCLIKISLCPQQWF